MIALEQALAGLAPDVRIHLVVDHAQLDRQPAQFVAVVRERQLKAVPDVHTERAAGTGEGGNESDFNLLAAKYRAPTDERHQHGALDMTFHELLLVFFL